MRCIAVCSAFAALVAVGAIAPAATAQVPAGDIVLDARAVGPTTPIKVYGVAGSVRLVGWDRDSMVITSKSRPPGFFFFVDRTGIKGGVDQFRFGVEEARPGTATPYHLTVLLPKHSKVAVKTASADIDATDVTGWFNSTAGTIQLRGSASSIEAESIDGNIDINANAASVRARTGRGRLLIRGSVQDVDASTVDGELDVASQTLLHGRFASVTGDIRYSAAPARGAIFDFSNHSGTVDMALPREASVALDLSSVLGTIENSLAQARPTGGGAHSLRVNLGRGDASITVRTFKGTIRLRPAQP